MSDHLPESTAETIRQWKQDYIARHADEPCVCHQLPDDISDDIICVSCVARRMADDV